jgi:hypothetical protein
MNKFWTWILKESGYSWMYLALFTFLGLSIYDGTLIFILFVSGIILAGTAGVYSHYKTLKKLGKWDKDSDYDKTYKK